MKSPKESGTSVLDGIAPDHHRLLVTPLLHIGQELTHGADFGLHLRVGLVPSQGSIPAVGL